MPKSKELKLDLPSVDELFTTEEERLDANREKVQEIPIDQIEDFPNHPFKIKEDEAMVEMAESIREYGVLVPALVRQKADGHYEMVAGHRRKCASRLAGMEEIPCIVRNLSDDEAIIIMIDSNLQREKILPSEKAFAYKMKLEAMKRQGKRTDLTSTPVARKLKGKESAEILGEQVGEGKDTVRRYIRLTELIEPLLDLVDENKIAFRPAVELSYLNRDEQEKLLDAMQYEDCTPSLAQATKIKQFSQENKLSEAVMLSILQEEKPNQVEKIKIPKERISKFFPKGTPEKKIEETIVKALELYQKRERQKQSAR
ncbi:ParB/RepB/Spo0J family partition protein [Eubacterium sp.]|uniref:ParB/RepB/Spo0J family partition protein n=1 Tax=Eubacterium sp. TaxID=142586 RepID=UPI0026DFB273|nr:ParB/RepB/Spo0J family partition protein [Eubacterium sp.]MDO5432618.1 ParB/RepB/Spo0J family partition protein [Eubacterium sp.]